MRCSVHNGTGTDTPPVPTAQGAARLRRCHLTAAQPGRCRCSFRTSQPGNLLCNQRAHRAGHSQTMPARSTTVRELQGSRLAAAGCAGHTSASITSSCSPALLSITAISSCRSPPPPPPGPCSRPKPPFRSPCRGQERTLSGEGRARRIHLPAAAAAAAPGPGPGPGSAAPAASRPGLRCRAGVCAGPAPPRRSAARTATMATPRRSGDGAGSAHGGAARGGSSARTAGLSVRAPREPLGAGLAARTLRLDPGDTKQPQPGALGSAPSATRVGGSEGGHHVPAPEIAPQPTSKSKFT